VTDAKLDRLGRELGERLEVVATGLAPRAPALRAYADDPVGFSKWAGREPADYQEAVMRAVAAERYVAWKSGHGVGKDWALGDLATWAAYARGMLVLVVSATERQVVGQTLREVKAAWRAHRAAGHALRGEWYAKSLRLGDEDRIIGVTGGASVDALTGWHDPRGVLVLVSESQAEALEESVYEALDSVTTNAESRVVVVGNPVRPFGPFHATFQRPTWRRFTTSAYDTPNVRAGRMVNPAFPAPDWPATAAWEHGGPESAWSVARIAGEFPDSVEDGLVQPGDLDAAADPGRGARAVAAVVRLDPPNAQAGVINDLGQWVAVRPSAVIVGGDPAGRGADATALAVVAHVALDGQAAALVWGLERWREPDATANAERITAYVWRLVHEARLAVAQVVVDESGLGAVLSPLKRLIPARVHVASIVDAIGYTDLREHSPAVVGFNAAWQAPSPARFVDTRAQSYVRVAELLARRALLLAPHLDPTLAGDLRAELLAHQTREETDGRVRVLAKDDVRKQLGRSPDLSDALVMAFVAELRREKAERPLHMRVPVVFG